MNNRFYKIWRLFLIWLLLIVASNLQLFGLYHLNPDITFLILSHLCWLAIYLTFRKTSKPSHVISRVTIILYLIFSICFWLHLNVIADSLIDRFPAVFERFYDFAFQYSSQLKSTFLMLAANLSMWAVLILSTWNGISNVIQKDDDKPSSEIKPVNLIWVSALVFIGLIYFALLRHNTFHSKAWDLAIFAQLIDNFRHGIFFEANVRGVSNIFSDHFTPIIYIFSPLLYIWNDPSRLLLVMQAAFITLGVIPTFLIARKRTNSQTVGFCMGVVYLLLPTLQYMNVFDFHPVVLSIPLMLFAWHYWESRRFSLMYLFLFLTLLCHEQMWIVVGALGLYLAFFERERIRGISLAIIGWGGFLCLVLWFFPMFRGGEEYFYIHRYAYLGDSMGEIIKSILTKPQLWLPRLVSPQSLMFILLMLLPVAFLPLWRPKYLLIILPTYFYSALSIESLQTSIFAQYAAPYVPFVIIASIYGLEKLSKKAIEKTNPAVAFKCVGFIAVCAVLVANVFLSPYLHSRAYEFNRFSICDDRNYFAETTRYKDKAVCAGSKFAPHLISRDLFLFPDYKNALYIILDMNDYHDSHEREEINKLLNTPGYEVKYINNSEYIRNSIIVLKKVHKKDLPKIPSFNMIQYSSDEGEIPIWIYTFHRKENRQDSIGKNNHNAPIQMECEGYYYPYGDAEGCISAQFVKVRETKQPYFGVLLYPSSRFDICLYGQPPACEIFQFWQDGVIKDDWQIGTCLKRHFFMPKAGYRRIYTGVDGLNEMVLPLFLLMPIPDDYPNTLEEYIAERYVQERWDKRIFHDRTVPKDGFRDEFEFVEYPDE